MLLLSYATLDVHMYMVHDTLTIVANSSLLVVSRVSLCMLPLSYSTLDIHMYIMYGVYFSFLFYDTLYPNERCQSQ